MPAEPGKFVWIKSGAIFEGYSDGRRVGKALTKAGELSRSHTTDQLYTWSEYSTTSTIVRGQVARYDPKTEEKAEFLRDYIAQLQRKMYAAEEELAKVYDYQAGDPPQEGQHR